MAARDGSDPNDIELRDAIQWSYNRYIGAPELLGAPLAYEPRAAWACFQCHAILVGVKSGELYRIADGDVKLLWQGSGTSIRAVHGCPDPNCLESPAAVADGNGNVHVIELGESTPRISTSWRLGEERKATTLRVIRSPEGMPWCFAATEDHNLRLAPLIPGSEGVVESVPRNVRWMLRQGTRPGVDASDECRWQLVSMEGHLASVRVSWNHGTPEIRRFSVGRLREAPTCVAGDRMFGRIRSIVYGFEKGLRVAMVDGDGIRGERILRGEPRVHYCRVVTIFGTNYLIACGDGGRIWSRKWDNPEDTRKEDWLEWPVMPSDILFVEVGRPSPDWRVDTTLILRNHRVYRVPLYHMKHVRQRLARVLPASARDGERWQARDDAESFAEVTCSADDLDVHRLVQLAETGGERTLEGIIQRLGRQPTPPPQEAIQISVAVLVASAILGRDTARRLARRLHRQLLVLVRDIPPNTDAKARTELQRLERWAVFLKKHYLLARTFSEKREQLYRYVTANAARNTPDALIYVARLRAQSFDVSWEYEHPLRSPVVAVQAPLTEGAATFAALSFADGSFARISLDGEWPRVDVDDLGNEKRRVFGNYSRVLHVQADGSWVVAPRTHEETDRARKICLRLPTRTNRPRGAVPLTSNELVGLDQHHQVHALHPLNVDEVLLGLRDAHQPLARWNIQKNTIDMTRLTRGSDLDVRSTVRGGERRFWSIVRLDRNENIDKQALAIGAEDGFLRLGTFNNRVNEFETTKVEFLGSAIRALAVDDVNGRILLLAGTERGEAFCFAVNDSFKPSISLKFRDLVRHPVASVFFSDLLPSGPQMCVLDRSGRLTCYNATRPSFLGARAGQFSVAEGASAAVPLGRGRVLVAGWDDTRQSGRLRIVQFCNDLNQPFDTSSTIQPLLHARSAASEFAAGRELDLLASFPLDDDSLRAALVGDRLGEDWDAARLRELGLQALSAYPSERNEIKALLEAATHQLRDARESRAKQVLENIYEVFIERRKANHGDRLPGKHQDLDLDDRLGAHDPRLQAAIVRRLLIAPTLQHWQPERHPDELAAWVERHLRHPERIVRVETMRALSEALFELLRDKTREKFKAAFPGDPPIRSAGWLLDAMTEFLLGHPPTIRGSECDASTWAAVSVLVNLVRLMPDSTFVILDRISLSRVEPSIFGVLKGRLESEQDREMKLWAKVDRYLPWVGQDLAPWDPTPADVNKHCQPFLTNEAQEDLRRELRIDAGQPDHDYWQAYVRCHSVLGRMIQVTNRDQLGALAGLSQVRPPDAPAWARDLWQDRERFLQMTDRWIYDHALPLLKDPSTAPESIATERNRLTSGPTGTASGTLGAPGLGIAKAILGHWHDVLYQPQPREGHLFGPYTLGPPIAGHGSVFRLREAPDRVAHIAEVQFPETEAFVDTWLKIEAASREPGSRIVPIVEVVRHAPKPGIVMKWLDANNLRESQGDLARREPKELYELAFNCAVDIGSALNELNAVGVYHGDIRTSNILWHPGTSTLEHSFHLIDFGRSGNDVRLRYKPPGSAGAAPKNYPGLINKLGKQLRFDSVAHMHLADAAALFQIIMSIISANAAQGLDAEWVERNVTALDHRNCPDHLQDWRKKLENRWQQRDWSPLSAQSLLDEAVGRCGRGVYVAAASDGVSGAIREALAKYFVHSGGHWIIQGHAPLAPISPEPVLSQLEWMMRRCSCMIFLLGKEPGSEPPVEHIPQYIRDYIDDPDIVPNWPQGRMPTHTQAELFIAKRLNKPVLGFLVEDGWADHRQTAVHCYLTKRGALTRIDLTTCGPVVGEALHRMKAAYEKDTL